MTNFKQLCSELYEIFEKYDDESNLAGIYWDMQTDNNNLFDRVKFALHEHCQTSKQQQALLAIDVAVADGQLSADVANVVRAAFAELGI